MVHTTLFLNNKNQAVRFHKSVAFAPGVHEVSIVAVGNSRVVTPVGHTWDAWFAAQIEDDAQLPEREQPTVQTRENLA
jgi:antitoxin VapB